MVILLFGWLFISGFTDCVIAKKNSNAFCEKGASAYFLYTCICSGTAMLVFAILARFNIRCNLITFIYVLIYCAIILLGYVVSLLVLKYTGVAKSSLIKMAGSSVLLFFLGMILFDESVGLYRWIGLIFMILTIFFSARKTEQDAPKKNGKFGLIICLVLNVVVSVSNSLLMKYYSLAQGVCDNNSYFFMTNLSLFAFGGIAFLISFIKNKSKVKELTREFKLKDYLFVVIRTVINNLSSLACLVLMDSVNLTFYTVLYSALNVISVIAASTALKEKVTLKLIFATIFAIASIVFNVL